MLDRVELKAEHVGESSWEFTGNVDSKTCERALDIFMQAAESRYEEVAPELNAVIGLKINMGTYEITKLLDFRQNRKEPVTKADVVFRTSLGTFLLLVLGKAQGTDLFMSGKMSLGGGNISLAIKAQTVLGLQQDKLTSSF